MRCCVRVRGPATSWRSPGRSGSPPRGSRCSSSEPSTPTVLPDAARAHALRAEFPAALDAQLAPRPPLADGVAAALAGATAMLDVSDGLAIDARRIAEASGVAIDLDGAPRSARRSRCAGGEDHALLATFPRRAPRLPGGFRRDRHRCAPASGLTVDGREYGERGGWDPYDDWNGGGGLAPLARCLARRSATASTAPCRRSPCAGRARGRRASRAPGRATSARRPPPHPDSGTPTSASRLCTSSSPPSSYGGSRNTTSHRSPACPAAPRKLWAGWLDTTISGAVAARCGRLARGRRSPARSC